MSRGGREVCDVVETAWRHGARFDAWTEFFSLDTWRAACAECGVDMEGIAQGQYETSWVTPWDHLSVGVTTRFFRRRRRPAGRTPDARLQLRTLLGVWRVSSSTNINARRSVMADFRLRVTYAETGRLVMLSHLEIARALERAVRRAGLPYAVSQGVFTAYEAGFRLCAACGRGWFGGNFRRVAHRLRAARGGLGPSSSVECA